MWLRSVSRAMSHSSVFSTRMPRFPLSVGLGLLGGGFAEHSLRRASSRWICWWMPCSARTSSEPAVESGWYARSVRGVLCLCACERGNASRTDRPLSSCPTRSKCWAAAPVTASKGWKDSRREQVPKLRHHQTERWSGFNAPPEALAPELTACQVPPACPLLTPSFRPPKR